VPDRAEAARWYADHLGFEPVAEFDFWATRFHGGPLLREVHGQVQRRVGLLNLPPKWLGSVQAR